MALPDRQVREKAMRVEALLAELESGPEEGPRRTATEAIATLLELQGEALERILRHVERAGALEVRRALAADEWVGQLLLLHDLHPESLEARVAAGLEAVRPRLREHGGDVELLAVEAGVARLRLRGSCQGCPSSTATLRSTVEEALRSVAPELERIETEGAESPGTLVPLASLRVAGGPDGGA